MATWRTRSLALLRRGVADRDLQIASGIFVFVTLMLALTASQGFVRDEGYYFKAAREYHAWFEGLWVDLLAGEPWRSFSTARLSQAFGYNTEHPGFVKLFMGWTWKIFHVWLGLVSNATGYRLASIIINAIGAVFTYLFGARLFSRPVGVLGVALLFVCPHVFYHSHLAAFDGPIMALGVAGTYAFWRSLSETRWAIVTGALWGIALATKHNAVFLAPTWAVAYAVSRWPWRWPFRAEGLVLPRVPLAFFAMALLGPLLLYMFYPYGWPSPLARLGAYYHYHLNHENYPVDYFGTLYREPPFPISYPFVMSAITIPVPVLFLGLAGYVGVLVRVLGDTLAPLPETLERRSGDWLLIFGALVPPCIIALPNVPIFGGTKHWMTMMPFFCLAAAWGLWRAATTLGDMWPARRGVAIAGVVGLTLLLPAIDTARTQPNGHTYFNELVLGHQGGAALGMPRHFWGGAGRALLDEINQRASPGDAVFSHRMNADDFRAYQADGLLRADVRWVGTPDQARWALAYHQREHQDVEYRIWSIKGDERPLKSVTYDGVPIVSLYQLR